VNSPEWEKGARVAGKVRFIGVRLGADTRKVLVESNHAHNQFNR
jgi:hypothetical protein